MMKPSAALVIFLCCLGTLAESDTGRRLLAAALAEACVTDETCMAVYAVAPPGVAADLAPDLEFVLSLHGLSDNATCAALATLPVEALVGMATGIGGASDTAEDRANAATVVYATVAMAALVAVVVAAFMALFAVMAARSAGGFSALFT